MTPKHASVTDPMRHPTHRPGGIEEGAIGLRLGGNDNSNVARPLSMVAAPGRTSAVSIVARHVMDDAKEIRHRLYSEIERVSVA